jgi:Xaa-Pro aminopeptidase
LRNELLTSERVRRAILRTLLEHDCFAREVIVAGGAQAADPHVQGEGPLRASEAIVLDIFPQHLGHGYWGDLTRTVVKGKPPAELKRMYGAVKAAQMAALRAVRAGVQGASVHGRAVAEFKRRGYETREIKGRAAGFIHGTGHGLGLAIHEAPSVSAAEGRLRAGNVITVEPGLYYPDAGGVRIEDAVVVTRTGCRLLARCEKRFEV